MSFCLIVAYVQKLTFYIYNKFDTVQPPWPSKVANMVDYEDIASHNLNFQPKILCWISTYPRNRHVSLTVYKTLFIK